MNFRDLNYLVKVAELKHFGKAAQACFVSQPTLSMQVKKLEQELGVVVFERSNKHVMLTPIGERLVQQAKNMLQAMDELHRLAKNSRDPYAKTLRLGVIPTLAPYLLPSLIQHIKTKFPKLSLQLYEAQTSLLVQKLKNAELDLILLALPIEQDGLTSYELYQEPFYLAVPCDHPLATEKKISLKLLAAQELLLLEDGHCMREQALDVCRLAGASEQQNFRATSLETLRQMVNIGSGITLIPKMAVRDDDKKVVYLPFLEPEPIRQIGLVWRSTSVEKELFTELAAFMHDCLNK